MDDEFEDPDVDKKNCWLPKVAKPPKQKITDPDELQEYRLRKRKFFEDNIRKNRSTVSNWLKYAAWEESQKEVQRARLIYERALEMNHSNVTIWLNGGWSGSLKSRRGSPTSKWKCATKRLIKRVRSTRTL